ncbi:hypothetical protein M0R45_010268 [Rubus argutus]|uniref:Uncharacterized protein n=1 Tax=Rubus argutus TaxID=59490 RepID=A0AAW1Y746_RUBAR
MKQTIFNIKRTWRNVLRIRRRINRAHNCFLAKFYNKYTPLCDEELRPNIEDSSSNWSRAVARTELSNFMFEQRVLRNGWLRWDLIAAKGLHCTYVYRSV